MPTNDAWGQGISITAPTDAPDIPATAEALASGLVPRSVMRFTSASTRNSTLSSPVAGMVAFLQDSKLFTGYDGTAWVVLAAGTQAWTTPGLFTGYTGNGNSNGTPQYRIVNLFGEQVVMWKGGLNVPYSGGSPTNSGNFLSALMPSGARPSALRTVTAACSAQSSDSLSVKVDFRPDGTVAIVTQSGVSPPWVSLNNIMYSL